MAATAAFAFSPTTLSSSANTTVLPSFALRATATATGSNLFCLTNYNGYDPETGDWYPPTRMYTFGPVSYTHLDVYKRQAMVIGSVEHDSWKTGITIGKGNIYNVGSLVCYGSSSAGPLSSVSVLSSTRSLSP